MKNLIVLFQLTGLIVLLLLAGCAIQNPTITEAPSKPESTPPETVTLTPTPPTPLPIDERVVMGELPNGLKYYIQKNAKPENRAELRLALAAGSMQEGIGRLSRICWNQIWSRLKCLHQF